MILVVLIRICLIPLFVKQVHAQRKMAQHAPQLQELRRKYKNDKQRLNEETMKFYKENGVNPLAGCLPMIPQMIIFFALFYVLRAIAEWKPGTLPKYGLTIPVLVSAQKATIFGVHLYDKLLLPHTPGMGLVPSIIAAITVALSATTTFMTVRQSSKRGLMQTNVDPDNPMAGMQKYMMYIVPFFSLTGLYWQYGLVLYWLTTNVWTLGQQFFMFRNWTAEDAQAAATAAAAGGAARAAQSSARPASGAARPASGSAEGTAAGQEHRRLGQEHPQRGQEHRRRGQDARPTAPGAPAPRSPPPPARRPERTGGRARRGPRPVPPPRAPDRTVRAPVRRAAMPPPRRPRPPRRTGRMVAPCAGCCAWDGRNQSPSPSRKRPPLRWSGSSRSGRPEASGRASTSQAQPER